jgi:hypothetical protein
MREKPLPQAVAFLFAFFTLKPSYMAQHPWKGVNLAEKTDKIHL